MSQIQLAHYFTNAPKLTDIRPIFMPFVSEVRVTLSLFIIYWVVEHVILMNNDSILIMLVIMHKQ